jgi:hypothetical protein
LVDCSEKFGVRTALNAIGEIHVPEHLLEHQFGVSPVNLGNVQQGRHHPLRLDDLALDRLNLRKLVAVCIRGREVNVDQIKQPLGGIDVYVMDRRSASCSDWLDRGWIASVKDGVDTALLPFERDLETSFRAWRVVRPPAVLHIAKSPGGHAYTLS